MEIGETRFEFYFDVDMPAEYQYDLVESLRAPGVGADVGYTGGGPGLVEIMAVVGIAASVMSTVKGSLEVADRIIQWRKKMREQGTATNIRIERPGHAPINLAVASDEEITLFITDGQATDSPNAGAQG